MGATSFEEERTEVWTSVVEAARGTDPDCAAACRYLLRHLIESAIPPSGRLGYDGRLKRGEVWEQRRAPQRHSG
ncbi:MAG TPA: hypothetical protein VMA31_15445 [Bryobacteraceae bacterium]|nr:hypothetical protein [Bryobacteraceae bacterium]